MGLRSLQEARMQRIFSRRDGKGFGSGPVLIAIGLVLLSFFGCPNPNWNLWFGEKRNESFRETKVINDRLTLRVSGSTHSTLGDAYAITLYVSTWFPIPQDELSFEPESIRAHVLDSVLSPRIVETCQSVGPRGDSTSAYSVTLGFYMVVGIENIPERGGVPIELVFNDFITYKGDPVFVDTISVLDKSR